MGRETRLTIAHSRHVDWPRLLASLLVAVLLIWNHRAAAQEVRVNPTTLSSTLNQQTLRAIFGMQLRQWPDGSPITVFVLPPDDPLHIAFCKKVLGVFPHQLQRAWDRLVFSGTGQAPIVVGSQEEMQRRIHETPGAIGYSGNSLGHE